MRENLDPILTDPDFLALPPEQDFLSQFRTMDTVPEEEAQWLVPGYIPQGQITLLAADGGVGKTSFWCQLLAALSTGRATLLEEVSPNGTVILCPRKRTHQPKRCPQNRTLSPRSAGGRSSPPRIPCGKS